MMNSSSAKAERLQELHSTATLVQQSATTRRVQIPECVRFMCEYSEVCTLVNKLQEHKARVMQSGQQEPDLQENIEVGVDKAVSRLMPMFEGPAQFWCLLFKVVEKLCAICNPAFDRDEVPYASRSTS